MNLSTFTAAPPPAAPATATVTSEHEPTTEDLAPSRRSVAWHLEYARRVGQHRNVTVDSPTDLTPNERHALAQSLAKFQIGETGDGRHLFEAADSSGTTLRYRDALAMFVAEEQEHARLLDLVIRSLDAPLRTSHWTERVFVSLRRMKSLRTEVLTLLVAELVALSYYAAIADGVPELSPVFDRIHDDEVHHIDFHAETLPRLLRQWPGPVRQVVRLFWNVLVVGTSVVVALDHRKALRVANVRPTTFIRRVWSDRRHLDHQLFG